MTVKRILNFLAVAEQEEKKTKSVNDVLMRTPYYHAKTNNMKIYSPKEIESATGMEKKRRQFWNDKAEQLAQNKKTRNQSKTVLSGLIDVSWTLRKTSMLESDVKKLLDEEKVLFRKDDVAGKKLGTQKKDTISKNVERMSAAHHAVEGIDQEVEEVQEAFQAAQTLVDRKKYSKEYERKKLLLDGAYTELKRAQDALTKSMKAKERDIENRLAERSSNVDVEEDDACPSSLGEIWKYTPQFTIPIWHYILFSKEQIYNYWGILISLQCISLLVSTSEVGDDYLTLLPRGKLLIADRAVEKISIVSIDSVCGLKLL